MKTKLLIFLTFILLIQSVFGVSTTIEKNGDIKDVFPGGRDKFLGNDFINPIDNLDLMNDLTFEGKRPKYVIVSRTPDYVPKNLKFDVYYSYKYYAFYDEFDNGEFVLTTDSSTTSISFGSFYEKISVSGIGVNVLENGLSNKSVRAYRLNGFEPKTNKYIKPSLEFEGYVENLFINSSGGFEYLGGAEFSYQIVKLDSETNDKFVDIKHEPFPSGMIQGVVPMGPQPLEIIPRMVQIAVIILVSLMALLMVLKASLRALRVLLGI